MNWIKHLLAMEAGHENAEDNRQFIDFFAEQICKYNLSTDALMELQPKIASIQDHRSDDPRHKNNFFKRLEPEVSERLAGIYRATKLLWKADHKGDDRAIVDMSLDSNAHWAQQISQYIETEIANRLLKPPR